MTLSVALVLALVSGVGAVTRALVDQLVQRVVSRDAPAGILVVNVSASFLLGIVTSVVADTSTGLLLSAGFLGAYSTFSTVSVDTLSLLRARQFGWALLNSVGMLFLGVLAVVTGFWIGTLF